MGAFQFVVLATLRAAQLIRGCEPRVFTGDHKKTVIAQCEVAEGKVAQLASAPIVVGDFSPPSIDDLSPLVQPI